MLLLELQHLPDLPITQRRLPLAHLPRHLRPGIVLRQELPRRHSSGDGIVGRVEDLEAQAILAYREMADLTQIPGVDVAPSVALPRLGPADVAREVARILVRLDHIPNAEGVDVVVEAAREGAGDAFTTQLATGVRVHGIDVVCIFVQREGVVGDVLVATLREADAVDGFRGGDDDLFDAQLAGGLHDVVC